MLLAVRQNSLSTITVRNGSAIWTIFHQAAERLVLVWPLLKICDIIYMNIYRYISAYVTVLLNTEISPKCDKDSLKGISMKVRGSWHNLGWKWPAQPPAQRRVSIRDQRGCSVLRPVTFWNPPRMETAKSLWAACSISLAVLMVVRFLLISI